MGIGTPAQLNQEIEDVLNPSLFNAGNVAPEVTQYSISI